MVENTTVSRDARNGTGETEEHIFVKAVVFSHFIGDSVGFVRDAARSLLSKCDDLDYAAPARALVREDHHDIIDHFGEKVHLNHYRGLRELRHDLESKLGMSEHGCREDAFDLAVETSLPVMYDTNTDQEDFFLVVVRRYIDVLRMMEPVGA